MTITRQRLNQILKEEVHRELQEQKLLQEKINVDKETYQKIMAKIIENANGSRKLYALTSNIDTVLVPWDSAISGRADDYYKIAQALTKGQRGRALRLDTMALIYGRIKNLDKETYLGDFDTEALAKDRVSITKSAIEIARNPEQFLSGLGRLGTKIGIGKSKLEEIRGFCSYIAGLFRSADAEQIQSEIEEKIQQNQTKEDQAGSDREKQIEKKAIQVLKRMLAKNRITAREMVSAANKYDDNKLDELADEAMRVSGLIKNKMDEDLYYAIAALVSNRRVVLKVLGSDSSKF